MDLIADIDLFENANMGISEEKALFISSRICAELNNLLKRLASHPSLRIRAFADDSQFESLLHQVMHVQARYENSLSTMKLLWRSRTQDQPLTTSLAARAIHEMGNVSMPLSGHVDYLFSKIRTQRMNLQRPSNIDEREFLDSFDACISDGARRLAHAQEYFRALACYGMPPQPPR